MRRVRSSLASFIWFVAFLLGLMTSAHSSSAQSPPLAHFKDAVTYDPGGQYAQSVAIADLNGDGKPDLVVADEGDAKGYPSMSGVGVLLGNGDGTFQPVVEYYGGGSFGSSVTVADVNGDGKLDLVVANECTSGGCGEAQEATIGVLLGNGDGSFQAPLIYAAKVYSRGDTLPVVAVGDVNGDGKPDIVVSDECLSASNCSYPTGPGGVSVLLGNGDGTFQAPVKHSSGGYDTTGVVIADINGDGKPDLIVSNFCFSGTNCFDPVDQSGIGVLLGNGHGSFAAVVSYKTGGYYARGLAVADLNDDGKPDVAVVQSCIYNGTTCDQNSVGVLLNKGNGTFGAAKNYNAPLGSGEGAIVIGDVNGDGKLDLVTTTSCSYCGTEVGVLPGNGDGTFKPVVSFRSGGYLYSDSVAIADLNHDGRPDVVVANGCGGLDGEVCSNNNTGSVSVLLNNFSANTETTLSSSPNPSGANQVVTFTATLTSPTSEPPNGSIVTFYNHQTKLGTGSTTNGVATFTTSFSSAETVTIKAVYSGDAFHTGSSGTVTQAVK